MKTNIVSDGGQLDGDYHTKLVNKWYGKDHRSAFTVGDMIKINNHNEKVYANLDEMGINLNGKD